MPAQPYDKMTYAARLAAARALFLSSSSARRVSTGRRSSPRLRFKQISASLCRNDFPIFHSILLRLPIEGRRPLKGIGQRGRRRHAQRI